MAKLPNHITVGENEYKLKIFKPQSAVWGNVVFAYVNESLVLAMVNGLDSEECRRKLIKGLAHNRIAVSVEA